MAKKCKFEKQKRSARLIAKYRDRRAELVAQIKNPETTQEDRMEAYRKLSAMPRNSSAVRMRNRCDVTGRPRAYMRKFRLCRVTFRELALEGKLPGVTKSSW